MPDTKKPLPALPPANPATLSIEARAHRGRLVRHLLIGTSESSIQARLDGWVHAIEEALDDLSLCIARGEWLAGVRRRRESKQRMRLSVAQENSAQSIQETPASIPKALQRLREHISQSTVPSPENLPFHILLCLAPCGVRVHLPSDDPASTSIGCSFASAKFLLPPDTDAEHIETSILYGLHEWDGEFSLPRFICDAKGDDRNSNTPSPNHRRNFFI